MGINNIIYLSEVIVLVIALLTLFIVFKVKHKKGLLKFLGISVGVFVIIFGITFVLEKPEIKLDEIKDIEVKSGEKIVLPNASYHFQDVTNNGKIVGNIDYDKIGEYEVTYEVNTLIGKYSRKLIVKVVDTTPPEISLEGGEEYKQSYAKEYTEPGVKVIDNYDGDITDKVNITQEKIDDLNFTVKYEVKDSSGNKAEKIRKVTIVDDIAPVITLNGSDKMNITLNGKYEEKGATAIDEKDGDLTSKIQVEGSVDTTKEGTYTITYKVSDNSQNEGVQKRTVIVKKQLVYDIQAKNGGTAGTIYLTFDDGPSTNITPKILDILKNKNVKATFFILNYNSQGEALVKRAYNEGHTIAIHGYSHDYNQIYKSEDAYMNNLISLQNKIKNSTGFTATITRFPGGSSNTVSKFNPGIMSRLCKLVVDRGFKYFDWNVSSGDAGGATNSDQVYNNVVKSLSKSRANVVLMHDFSSNAKVLDALPRIIDFGIENGYSFSKITENTPMVTHKPNN